MLTQRYKRIFRKERYAGGSEFLYIIAFSDPTRVPFDAIPAKMLFGNRIAVLRKITVKVQAFCAKTPDLPHFTTRVALTFQTIFQINNLLNLQIIGWF
ncbi:hypothetical protein, partial [Paenibacillus barengoltzii]|uniref:hypothetical protein n=1 Tax=Paenibacillus barengoltzii TaxID=343517 RepID=UPI00387A6F45